MLNWKKNGKFNGCVDKQLEKVNLMDVWINESKHVGGGI